MYFGLTHACVFETTYSVHCTVTWFLFKSKFTIHTIKPPLLECVQSNTILWNDLNRVQFTQLSLAGSKIKQSLIWDCSNAELNQIQSMDWVLLCSITFEFLTFDRDIAQDVFSSERNRVRLVKAACHCSAQKKQLGTCIALNEQNPENKWSL